MRVIYDDSKAKEVVNILDKCMEDFKVSLDLFIKYEHEMRYIRPSVLYKKINKRLEERGFRIGKTVLYVPDINNDLAYPVYFDTPDEVQKCCIIHIDRGACGEAWVYLTDYNTNRISKTYELHHTGITVSQVY